jgi:nucleotidyltransferase substrate binding protein (TIGR01987 family)
MPPETPRWFYRFDNYKRAFNLLRQAIETQQQRELTQLEKEGVIQRFEYTWELAWKVLKDYLESEGQVLPTITPAAVIRAAHAAKIIDHGDIWMRALDARNRMAHTYDLKSFEQVISAIAGEYLSVLDALHLTLLEKSLEARNA